MPFSYQEARTFNESPVNPRKCNAILTKILYLLNQGEVLGTTEATECFFAITKLFQEKDKVSWTQGFGNRGEAMRVSDLSLDFMLAVRGH